MNVKTDKLTERSWVTHGELPDDLQLDEDRYRQLWESRPGFKNKIKLFGKEHDIPRQQMVFGVKDYAYSGTTFDCHEIPENLQKYLDWANTMSNSDNKFNMILVNWYEDGSDYIGSHRDDEKEIIPQTDVMTISFGSPRIFRVKYSPKNKKIRENTNSEIDKKDYLVENNTFLIMGGNFQDEFKHEIPKQKKVKTSRISLKFRKFKN